MKRKKSEYNLKIGGRIKRLREALGLTQKDFMLAMGYQSTGTVSQMDI